MRKWTWVCLLACASVLGFSENTQASEGFEDVVKLVKSGVSEDILMAYVDASSAPYDLSIDEILFLNDLGVSSKIISAVVKRGKENRTNGVKVVDPLPVRSSDPENIDIDALTADELTKIKSRVPPEAPTEAEAEPAPEVETEPEIEGDLPATGKPVGIVNKTKPIQNDEAKIDERIADVDSVDNDEPRDVVIKEAYVDRPEVVERVVEREVIYEQPVTVVAPAPEAVNVSFFYESLSPYGKWVTVDGDWVWCPTVAAVDHSWRPYSHRGHWVATDCGWAWQSDYSWGWAPFHYGRWDRHDRHGWVWHPDTVWAPAWVSWRTCDSHYGWAPLPRAARYEAGIGFSFHGKHVDVDFSFGLIERDYGFVPSERFCDSGLNNHYIHGDQSTHIYNNTTIIQNNYTYNDNRIINRGPAINNVKKATKREIKEVKIADANVKQGDPIRSNGVRDNKMYVYRPEVKNTVPETPPAVLTRRENEAKRQAASKLEREMREAKQLADKTTRKERTQHELLADRKRAEEAAQRIKDRAAEKRDDRDDKTAERKQKLAEEAEARKAKQAKQDELENARKAAAAAKKQPKVETRASSDSMARTEVDAETRRKVELDQRRLNEAHEKAARDQRAKEVSARENALKIERQSKAAEEAAARDKARLEAQARQDAIEAQRKAEAEARKQKTLIDTNGDGLGDATKAEARRREAQARAAAEAEARRNAAAESDARRNTEAEARKQKNDLVDTDGDGIGDSSPAEVRRRETQARAAEAEAQRKAEADARKQKKETNSESKKQDKPPKKAKNGRTTTTEEPPANSN